MKSLRLVLLAILLIVAITTDSTDFASISYLKKMRKEIVPPARFHHLWAAVENCSGITGNMSDFRFYFLDTPKSSWFSRDIGQPIVGLFMFEDKSITFIGQWQNSDRVVKHEMLHALISPPYRGHPPEFFIDRCKLM